MYTFLKIFAAILFIIWLCFLVRKGIKEIKNETDDEFWNRQW